MLLGIIIGAGVVVLIVLAYAVGYGMADQKYNSSKED